MATGPTPVAILAGPLQHWLNSNAVQTINDACPGVPILAICSSATAVEAVSILHQGAATVLLLTQPVEKLVNAIQLAIDSGQKSLEAAAAKQQLTERLATLTEAENQVLDAMLIGMANKQIAQRLEIGLRTVELRRSKIMRKMHAKSLAELVKFVCIAKGVVSMSNDAAEA